MGSLSTTTVAAGWVPRFAASRWWRQAGRRAVVAHDDEAAQRARQRIKGKGQAAAGGWREGRQDRVDAWSCGSAWF